MSHQLNRRRFLKQSAWLSGGLWVIGSRVAAADDSPNERLDIALIGVGGKGASNLKSVQSENIVALCDIDEHSLAEASQACPHAKTFHDFRKMLDQPGIDAVVVTTPDHTHAVATVRALRLGKHVYCEKPLTHSIREARLVAREAAKAGVATQMGNAGHSSESTRQVVELIRAGAIGPVREVHSWTNRPIWPQGIDRPTDNPPVPASVHWDLWLGPAPERPYNPAYHPFKWRGWWDFGTGALGDMGCHILDTPFWALELGSPASLEAECSGINPETGPTWSIIRYEFPERSASQPAVTLTWYDGGKLPPAELLEGQELNKNGGSLFVGKKGKLLVHHGRGYKLLPESKFKDFERPQPSLPRSPGHHREWIEACKSPGRTTGTHFPYAAALTEVVLLGNVALRAKGKISWNAAAMQAIGAREGDVYIDREPRRGWSFDS